MSQTSPAPLNPHQEISPMPAVTVPHWRTFVVKVYFDRLGKVERAVQQLSSGHKQRDANCMAYAKKMTIVLPRLKTKQSGQVWRVVRIPPDVVLE